MINQYGSARKNSVMTIPHTRFATEVKMHCARFIQVVELDAVQDKFFCYVKFVLKPVPHRSYTNLISYPLPYKSCSIRNACLRAAGNNFETTSNNMPMFFVSAVASVSTSTAFCSLLLKLALIFFSCVFIAITNASSEIL